jgi:hypothetical protein
MEFAANAIGDSWLNTCFETSPFFDFMGDYILPFFVWTEPYPLLVLLLIVLVVLPSIFRFPSKDSYLKISRIYTSTRLGVMSILHQVCYSYTVAMPLSLFVKQPFPCSHSSTFDRYPAPQYPDALTIAASIFVFSVVRYSHLSWKISVPVCTVFLTILMICFVCLNTSVFQILSALCISYILHFAHLHMFFKWLHWENAFLALFAVAGMLYAIFVSEWPWELPLLYLWFAFVSLVINEMILIRYHLSRGGFRSIERPCDLNWAAEMSHAESIRLLNSEQEDRFTDHLASDFVTSAVALSVFFVGQVVRFLLNPSFFISNQ